MVGAGGKRANQRKNGGGGSGAFSIWHRRGIRGVADAAYVMVNGGGVNHQHQRSATSPLITYGVFWWRLCCSNVGMVSTMCALRSKVSRRGGWQALSFMDKRRSRWTQRLCAITHAKNKKWRKYPGVFGDHRAVAAVWLNHRDDVCRADLGRAISAYLENRRWVRRWCYRWLLSRRGADRRRR